MFTRALSYIASNVFTRLTNEIKAMYRRSSVHVKLNLTQPLHLCVWPFKHCFYFIYAHKITWEWKSTLRLQNSLFSSTCEQSNKRSWAKLKMESETGRDSYMWDSTDCFAVKSTFKYSKCFQSTCKVSDAICTILPLDNFKWFEKSECISDIDVAQFEPI